MFDGSTQIFEKLKRNHSVDIIWVTKENKILLIHEEQPGRKPFVSLVSGWGEDWESPLDTAKREFLEETWCTVESWELFGSYSFSSRIDYQSHLFIARWVEKFSQQNLDAGEKISIIECDWEEFKTYVVRDDFRVKEFTLEFLKHMYFWKEEELKKRIFGE
jgi:ADP-ribose pyrophosphatase YjhB (NUDIX family)